jgi:hypothetical protein
MEITLNQAIIRLLDNDEDFAVEVEGVYICKNDDGEYEVVIEDFDDEENDIVERFSDPNLAISCFLRMVRSVKLGNEEIREIEDDS